MPSGNREVNRVRFAEREGDGLALQLGAIADAHDVELFLEARRHAHARRWQPTPAQAREARGALPSREGQSACRPSVKGDAVRYREGELALRPLHVDFARLHGNLHACRH